MKTCTKCKNTLSKLAFSKDSRRKDNLQGWCKSCMKKATCRWRKSLRGKESQKQRDKKYGRTEKGKKTNKKASAKHREVHPERTKAHNAVMIALRNGRLTKQPCPCGETKVEGHHEDYSKPLDVEWLCTKHHKQLHYTRRMNMNQYCTVRTVVRVRFYVNVISYEGIENTYGKHEYAHKRSARRAAIALAKKLDISYRQDLEYSDNPHAFVAPATGVKEATV